MTGPSLNYTTIFQDNQMPTGSPKERIQKIVKYSEPNINYSNSANGHIPTNFYDMVYENDCNKDNAPTWNGIQEQSGSDSREMNQELNCSAPTKRVFRLNGEYYTEVNKKIKSYDQD
ncbi:hypothetical protein HELRODRAFT_177399 [Helobdella robusta]|uniref:Uncharacterized protein n=1 Tax=Helobdella robusta TaxID=6412 RepID=T1FBM6_HELRO|nr:hypothetical protein HELRODRAFT_177399 [Helobdella robusta]ESN98156.1 hypothetical protein HELRODRAFT_177399 [Helobdella robusta]